MRVGIRAHLRREQSHILARIQREIYGFDHFESGTANNCYTVGFRISPVPAVRYGSVQDSSSSIWTVAAEHPRHGLRARHERTYWALTFRAWAFGKLAGVSRLGVCHDACRSRRPTSVHLASTGPPATRQCVSTHSTRFLAMRIVRPRFARLRGCCASMRTWC